MVSLVEFLYSPSGIDLEAVIQRHRQLKVVVDFVDQLNAEQVRQQREERRPQMGGTVQPPPPRPYSG